MRHFLAVVLATLGAAFAPAVCFTVWLFAAGGAGALAALPMMFLAACFVALPHALLLGLPVAGWLLRIGRFQLLPMALAGAAVGGIPAAILRASNWNAGNITMAEYAGFGAVAAGLGAVGSVAFLVTYRGVSPNNSFKPMPLRGTA